MDCYNKSESLNESVSLCPSTPFCPWRETFRTRQAALIDRWKDGGLFADGDLDDINCYWLQFEPAPLVNHLALAFLFFVVSLVGGLANTLAIYILSTSRYLKTPVNVIITNLAVSDLLMLVKMPVFIYNSLVQGPALGYRGCEMYGFIGGVTGCVSIMSLAAVAVERYLVITRPFKGDKKPTLTWAYVTAAFTWLYSAFFAVLPFVGIGKYVPEGYLTSCSFDYLSDDSTTRIFIFSYFLAGYVIPVSVITGCYIAVVRYVSLNDRTTSSIFSPEDQQQQQNPPGDPSEPAGIPEEERRKTRCWIKCFYFELSIAKIAVGLVALWLVAWTPYAVVALMGVSGHHHFLTPGVTMLPALFAKLSACINPFIYSLNHPKIRNEMARRCRCFTVGESMITAEGTGQQQHQRNSGARSGGSPIIRFTSRVVSRTDDGCSSEQQQPSLVVVRQLAVSRISNNLPNAEELSEVVNGPPRRPAAQRTKSLRQPSDCRRQQHQQRGPLFVSEPLVDRETAEIGPVSGRRQQQQQRRQSWQPAGKGTTAVMSTSCDPGICNV